MREQSERGGHRGARPGLPLTDSRHRVPRPEQLEVVAEQPGLPGPLSCPPHLAWAWQGMGLGRGMEGQGNLPYIPYI